MLTTKLGAWCAKEGVKKFARVAGNARVLDALKLQSDGSCMPTTIGAMKKITGVTKTKSMTGGISKDVLEQKLRNHPVTLVGTGIAGPGTKYTSHHAILLLEMVGDEICVVDLDNTAKQGEGKIYRVVKVDDLLNSFVPDTSGGVDMDGSMDEPRESLIEPKEDDGGMCVIQ